MRSLRLIPAFLAAAGMVSLAAADAPKEPRRLSLQEAISTALENNLQVKIQRLTQEQVRYGIMSAEGAYDWQLRSTLTLSKDTRDPVTKFGFDSNYNPGMLTTSSDTVNRDLSVSVNKAFDFGGQFTAGYKPGYSNTTSYTLFDPQDPAGTNKSMNQSTQLPWGNGLSLGFTQPLLKNFGREVAGAPLLVARKNSEKADLTFQLSVIQFVAETENAYWDLVYSQRNLENKKLALQLAQKQLRENQIRVEVGTMAPIEVTSAEAQVALQEQAIIQAEAAVANAKDNLMRTLYPEQERPQDLFPTDTPTTTIKALEEGPAMQSALDKRLELKASRLGLDISKINERVSKQNRMPQLDLNLGASTNSFPQQNYWATNKDLGQRKNPGYSVGLTFAVPIVNRSGEAALASARAARRASELTLKDQETSITLEVRTALRNLEAAQKGVVASQKTRIFSERDFEAEQKKFENGMSTNFVVLSKQSALDNARASELNAQIIFVKAITTYERAIGNLLEARNLKVN